jgi:hypothetical protein
MRRKAIIAGGALALLIATFVAGRYSRPARVVERVKVETKIQTVTQWKDRIVAKRVRGPVREVERIVEKPGAERVITRWIERGPVTTDTTSDAAGQTSATSTSATSATKTTETGRPGWSVEIRGLWDPRAPAAIPDRLTLGIDRRVIGTVWLGAAVSGEPRSFPDLRVGLSARLEF